ncbi:5'-nucleotidase domain-containing protein 1 isoform X3 [Chiloscyllium punctatum]|uniref:5'-nucleotidase domain-containing protein 1 isoform X3 n=1 Tax=Chiloscyllium punctatum TaxID=137246 RepID=UPI003B6426F7
MSCPCPGAMAEHFSLSDCDVIGFDLDHTLCRYNVSDTFALIYDSFAQFLVEQRGYDRELMTLTPDCWDFCFKGLLLDLEDGNLLKLGEDGTVLRASHGTRLLTGEEILETYGKKRKWKHFKTINGTFARSGKYHFYDNYFDLPGALLCARVVDILDQNRTVKKYEFWKDVIASIEYNYKASAFKEDSGIYFPSVKKDPGKYLLRCSESVKDWLRKLKNAGKVLLLITSSHSDYCRLLCEHILGEDFEEIFDIIITNALKPGFFTQMPQQRPFRTLATKRHDQLSLVATRADDKQHEFDWDNTTIIGQAKQGTAREFLETWHSSTDSINKHIDLDPIYRPLQRTAGTDNRKRQIQTTTDAGGKITETLHRRLPSTEDVT